MNVKVDGFIVYYIRGKKVSFKKVKYCMILVIYIFEKDELG